MRNNKSGGNANWTEYKSGGVLIEWYLENIHSNIRGSITVPIISLLYVHYLFCCICCCLPLTQQYVEPEPYDGVDNPHHRGKYAVVTYRYRSPLRQRDVQECHEAGLHSHVAVKDTVVSKYPHIPAQTDTSHEAPADHQNVKHDLCTAEMGIYTRHLAVSCEVVCLVHSYIIPCNDTI